MCYFVELVELRKLNLYVIEGEKLQRLLKLVWKYQKSLNTTDPLKNCQRSLETL